MVGQFCFCHSCMPYYHVCNAAEAKILENDAIVNNKSLFEMFTIS